MLVLQRFAEPLDAPLRLAIECRSHARSERLPVEESPHGILVSVLFPSRCNWRGGWETERVTLADATDTTDQRAVWQHAEAPRLYRDEVLQHVSEFLFAEPNAGPCEYFKVTGDALNSIFHGRALLQLPGGVTLPFKPTRRIGIELFLTKYGIGILSIALTPEKENLPILMLRC